MNGTPNNTSARFVISHDFLRAAFGDCISDERMEEIIRRLVSVIPDNLDQDVVRSESAPNDKSKLWYVPSTKKLFVYNSTESAWEETNVDNISVCLSPDSHRSLSKNEAGCLFLDPFKMAGTTQVFTGSITADGAGAAVKTIALDNFEDQNATVTVNPKQDLGAAARWWISDHSETSVTISFAGLTALTTYACQITVTQSA